MYKDMAKKQFGASGLNSLNSAIDSINDAVEQYATPIPTPVAPSAEVAYGVAEKSQTPTKREKTTVGINIEIPKEDYRRLQNSYQPRWYSPAHAGSATGIARDRPLRTRFVGLYICMVV